MFDVLGALKSVAVKVKKLQVDNGVFRLHYRFTVLLLLAFSILVTSKQYIGDPIECTSTGTKLREEMIDQYCWVSSTHTVPNACNKQVGPDVIAPCVDKRVEGEEIVSHQYYQWVCFVLFLQAIMFYLPHFVWKSWESGRLKALTTDLDGPLVNDEVKATRIQALQAYFHVSLHRHNFYAVRYAACELLNFVNVFGQLFLTNQFLGGTFLTYGTEVIKFTQLDQLDRADPMVVVFPRVTKCTFYTFGPGGNPQNHDAVCVLPINIINEKIYIVLWFWFIILTVVSGLAIVYRLATMLSADVRSRLLATRATSVDRMTIDSVSRRVKFGDWFLLYLLSKNINSYTFRDVVEVVNRKLDGYSESTPEAKKLNDKVLV